MSITPANTAKGAAPHAAWSADAKREKMAWAARMRQAGSPLTEISKLIDVPYGTLKRWMAEAEGQAILHSMAADVLDQLCDKNNMHLPTRLAELVNDWVRIDTTLRRTHDMLSPEYSRGFVLRCRIENHLHRLTGGQWYLPRQKTHQVQPDTLEAVPQPGQVLPDLYGYDRTKADVIQDYLASQAAGALHGPLPGALTGSPSGALIAESESQIIDKQTHTNTMTDPATPEPIIPPGALYGPYTGPLAGRYSHEPDLQSPEKQPDSHSAPTTSHQTAGAHPGSQHGALPGAHRPTYQPPENWEAELQALIDGDPERGILSHDQDVFDRQWAEMVERNKQKRGVA